MASFTNTRSEGPTVPSDFAPALSLFSKKAPSNNIAVGPDEAQILFLEHQFGIKPMRVPFVNDDMLLGQSGLFFAVRMPDLSDWPMFLLFGSWPSQTLLPIRGILPASLDLS